MRQGHLFVVTLVNGNTDTEWIGTFEMARFMNSLETEVGETQKRKKERKKHSFKVGDLAGPWRVEAHAAEDGPRDELVSFEDRLRQVERLGAHRAPDGRRIRWDDVVATGGASTGGVALTVYEVVLRDDFTWESTAGFGDGKLSGRWNIFEADMELNSGIKGQGSRLWLSCRRFGILGGEKCRGVPGLTDFLYLGSIGISLAGGDGDVGKDANAPVRVALRVSGHIAHGWGIEPVFTGSFNMTRPDRPPGLSIE